MPDLKEANDVTSAEQAADSEDESSTLASVEAKLATMRGDNVESNDDNSEDNLVSEDSNENESPNPNEENTKDSGGDDSPLLPSGHRRAALARGYTTEEIDHYLSTKPDEAVGRFAEIYNDWSDENSRWSSRGRQLMEAGKKESGEQESSPKSISHFDMDALIEEHGNEDLIKALAAPLNATIDQVNIVIDKLGKSEDFVKDTEEQALIKVTQDFLTSSEMKPYADMYGTAIETLTDEQTKNRMGLFKQADIIVAGAQAHGMSITTQDALERAHVLKSQGTRDEFIRQGIRDNMKKRTKTASSSHQQLSASDDAQPLTDKEMEERTTSRLRALRDKK